ncbi:MULTISPECIES: YbhB/YbcL family Raf kinase inhibitor-like protein [Legionella]|uniref:Phosphatidylethanolamine-binding protein PebP n=1 Tax=Legionella drozanskii LLAP-1 TaxID=1212489 RepID=A0A0W0SW60_9GAMM|nr:MULTISPECIES: YbhB/YbcL family Raf kinase inhibitor-like protein [Legionella]KTC87532.1 phosphatidylethanolamine-binding protein PebP [Legionella drozanskii LLAP-1]PJE10435.1 MAG: YbhB/YbcL family Raf kinase inhibitor-like protein [Legionella sp.]
MKKKYGMMLFIFLACLSLGSFAASLSLNSPAFSTHSPIPPQYTCNGADISPPLFWQSPPVNTQSFVLIVDDPDAPSGDWVHWLIFNIPVDTWLLSEATEVPAGAVVGKNSWGQTRYRGPCPPSGTHHYFFRLFALDTVLNLNSKADKYEVLKAMQNHVLETSELSGVYSKE